MIDVCHKNDQLEGVKKMDGCVPPLHAYANRQLSIKMLAASQKGSRVGRNALILCKISYIIWSSHTAFRTGGSKVRCGLRTGCSQLLVFTTQHCKFMKKIDTQQIESLFFLSFLRNRWKCWHNVRPHRPQILDFGELCGREENKLKKRNTKP